MVRIRKMTVGDVPRGMELKDQAGWNQTEADWQRFLELEPDGCFVAELGGQAVGTAAACAFGSVGWIAMILVDAAVRGQGIGTRLVEHAIAYLDERGVRTARLDATPLGGPIYQRLGFLPEYELARWEGVALPGASHPCVAPATADQLNAVTALDRRVTGTDRERLIHLLHRQGPEAMRVFTSGGKLLGYVTLRSGSRALQIGPAIALSEEAGCALLEAAFQRCAGRSVFVDVPRQNAPATRWAEAKGLAVQRYLTRMRRGRPVSDRPIHLWASSGPENG
jgi:GNAT superfamily N-acetyltransferase